MEDFYKQESGARKLLTEEKIVSPGPFNLGERAGVLLGGVYLLPLGILEEPMILPHWC